MTTSVTPFMLEVLRRIDLNAAKSRTPGWCVRDQFPQQQIKGLAKRGLIQFRTEVETVRWSGRKYETEKVGLTEAGLAELATTRKEVSA